MSRRKSRLPEYFLSSGIVANIENQIEVGFDLRSLPVLLSLRHEMLLSVGDRAAYGFTF